MNVAIAFTLVTAVFIAIGCEPVAGQKSGPYDLILKRIAECDDPGTDQIRIGTRIHSRGHNVYTYSNNVTLAVPWDHLTKTDVEIQQLSNGVYIPRFITQSFKTCEKFTKVAKDLMTDFLKAGNYTFTGCPVPAGFYPVRDWVVNFKLNNVPTMFYNSYKMIVTFTRQRARVGCTTMYFDAVPKES